MHTFLNGETTPLPSGYATGSTYASARARFHAYAYDDATVDVCSPRRLKAKTPRGRLKAEVLLSAENRNRNRKSIVSGPKPSASLMPACQGPQSTVPDADVDSAASFHGYLYIVSQ